MPGDSQQQPLDSEPTGEEAAAAAWQAHQIMSSVGPRAEVSRWRLHPATLSVVRAFAKGADGRYIVTPALDVREGEQMLTAPFVADREVPRGSVVAEVTYRG